MIIEFVFTWPLGDYGEALNHYLAAREFALSNGLAMGDHASHIAGLVLSPFHPEWKRSEKSRFVPMHLIDDPRWTSAVQIVTDNAITAGHVRKLPLPEGVTRMERDVTNEGGKFIRPASN